MAAILSRGDELSLGIEKGFTENYIVNGTCHPGDHYVSNSALFST